jgi:hypothetical protein
VSRPDRISDKGGATAPGRRHHALPPSVPPRGLNREQTAKYLGVSPEKFDSLIIDDRMPKPIPIDASCWIGNRYELDHARATTDPIKGVYVIGFRDYVKIGWSQNVVARKTELQTGVPERLKTYAVLNVIRDMESDLHRRFWAYRLQGEWFRLEGELRDWVEAGCPL